MKKRYEALKGALCLVTLVGTSFVFAGCQNEASEAEPVVEEGDDDAVVSEDIYDEPEEFEETGISFDFDRYQPAEKSENCYEEKYFRLSKETIQKYQPGSAKNGVFPFEDFRYGSYDYEVESGQRVGLVDGTGTIVLDGYFDSYWDTAGFGDDYWSFRKDDRMVFITKDGNAVIEPEKEFTASLNAEDTLIIFNQNYELYADNTHLVYEGLYEMFDGKGQQVLFPTAVRFEFVEPNLDTYTVDSGDICACFSLEDCVDKRYLIFQYYLKDVNGLEEGDYVDRYFVYDLQNRQAILQGATSPIQIEGKKIDMNRNKDIDEESYLDEFDNNVYKKRYGNILFEKVYAADLTRLRDAQTGDIIFAKFMKNYDLGDE